MKNLIFESWFQTECFSVIPCDIKIQLLLQRAKENVGQILRDKLFSAFCHWTKFFKMPQFFFCKFVVIFLQPSLVCQFFLRNEKKLKPIFVEIVHFWGSSWFSIFVLYFFLCLLRSCFVVAAVVDAAAVVVVVIDVPVARVVNHSIQVSKDLLCIKRQNCSELFWITTKHC